MYDIEVTIKKPVSIYQYLEQFHLAKAKIYKLHINNLITVNGLIKPFDELLNPQDLLKIIPHPDFIKLYKPSNKNIEVLYEDQYVAVVNKEKKIIIHPDGNTEDTLINRLSSHVNSPLYTPHRIDYDTTGIVLFSKNFLLESYFDYMFQNHLIERKYILVVHGKTKKEGKIDFPIGGDRHVNGKMVVSKNGKKAITHYRTLKSCDNASLVEARLETGRTHQIRVHFSSIGHHLFGDTLYGSNDNFDRVALHSSKIKFYNPMIDKTFSINANLPCDLEKLIKDEIK